MWQKYEGDHGPEVSEAAGHSLRFIREALSALNEMPILGRTGEELAESRS